MLSYAFIYHIHPRTSTNRHTHHDHFYQSVDSFTKTVKYCYSLWVTNLSPSTSWLSSTANLLLYQKCFDAVLNSIYLAVDVERNPGPRPPRFPCDSCQKACSSYRGAKASILASCFKRPWCCVFWNQCPCHQEDASGSQNSVVK